MSVAMQLGRRWCASHAFCVSLLGFSLVGLYVFQTLWRGHAVYPLSQLSELDGSLLKSNTNSRHQVIKPMPAVNLRELGAMVRRDRLGWKPVQCRTNRNMKPVTLHTEIGNFTVYLRGSASEDSSVTKDVLEGKDFFQKKEITRFLKISTPLPLIDVGANVGLVSLQAAIQNREVAAIEPIFDNAVRLCRAALDFGRGDLVQVIQNAASSHDGEVALATDVPTDFTNFTFGTVGKFQPTNAYAIVLDRLLEIVNFQQAALKIDVGGHEAHVLYAASRLFKYVHIPLVWLEWQHVKKIPGLGLDAEFILHFMRKHQMAAHDLMSGHPLDEKGWKNWPVTVLLREKKRRRH